MIEKNRWLNEPPSPQPSPAGREREQCAAATGRCVESKVLKPLPVFERMNTWEDRFQSACNCRIKNIVGRLYRDGQQIYGLSAYHDTVWVGGQYYEVGEDLVSRNWWLPFR